MAGGGVRDGMTSRSGRRRDDPGAREAPWFDGWWHGKETWSGAGHADLFDWLKEDAATTERWVGGSSYRASESVCGKPGHQR
jgi:hypothetical protein